VTHVAGVVLAGGSGSRFGRSVNKVYLPLAGRPVLWWSLRAMARHSDVLVLVTRSQDVEFMADVVGGLDVEVVEGGTTRQGSELAALRHLAPRVGTGAVDTILIHDGARPLASPELVNRVLAATGEYGGAIPGLRSEDLAEVTADGRVLPLAEDLVAVQTPQGFSARPLLAAYEQAAAEGFDGTDTASCVERYTDIQVHWVPGEQRNLKVTYEHDLLVAERVMEPR
jgi:2-C-methyl-D-erythritol 4-phosphate cytidylyltransferase